MKSAKSGIMKFMLYTVYTSLSMFLMRAMYKQRVLNKMKL